MATMESAASYLWIVLTGAWFCLEIAGDLKENVGQLVWLHIDFNKH